MLKLITGPVCMGCTVIVERKGQLCAKCTTEWCGWCNDWTINGCGSVEACEEYARERERDDESDWGGP